ncbi:MAG: DUF1653 domain-containing protein [bacterium]|nr:DUF1653 domain-containing protein [bacterium]
MKISTNIPEAGFYYHNKHTSDSVNNYAYELMGVGIHTEDDCTPEDANMVVYRPLYKSEVFNNEKFFWLRPLEMWTEKITKDGKTFPRFSKISDPEIISKLESIKKEMYGD